MTWLESVNWAIASAIVFIVLAVGVNIALPILSTFEIIGFSFGVFACNIFMYRFLYEYMTGDNK